MPVHFAFWGRDFSNWLKDSQQPADRLAYRCLRDWLKPDNRSGKRQVIVFDYHGAFSQWPRVYPPLINILPRDMKHYKEMGCAGFIFHTYPDTSHIQRKVEFNIYLANAKGSHCQNYGGWFR
ncbi:MAG: hypothetical protein SVV80_09420 [Planctomycetota bacterium]|nr:hypothetical protein [Planctomycetota bacterium]